MARGPSPRSEASRRGSGQSEAPWLEEAEPEPDVGRGGTLIGRSTSWLILVGLLLLVSMVAAGVFMVARQEQGDIDALPPGAEIPVLRDPGPWKVAPEGPGVDGVPVEGQDQLLFGTGDGADPDARIALDALPEEPVARDLPSADAPAGPPPTDLLPDPMRGPAVAAPEAGSAKPKAEVSVAPDPAATRPAAAPVATAPSRPATDAAGSLVQLGAFSSDARARAAWKGLSERFAYLSGLTPLILPVANAEGRTLYRLRADTGSPAAAADICGRLKVAGESCAVVGGG